MAKLRVYELAKELGLTNKECIDLCNALGYGVKSHSSSLDGAYADQVRRKAEREGLIRDEQPVEEKPAKKPAAKKASAKKPAADKPEPAPQPEVAPTAEPATV
ncbi:MAG TPA: translation initiation factor IF-2 N-terminal domain-containing protein, partial [Microthrixaceae bacterium]|nr:translation initiation factor IF-2 N-terminal domain-containing protein [Microthrixaceae bacterium]